MKRPRQHVQMLQRGTIIGADGEEYRFLFDGTVLRGSDGKELTKAELCDRLRTTNGDRALARYVIIGFTSPDCMRIHKVYGPVTMEEASRINGSIPNGVVVELHEVPRTQTTRGISMIDANVG